MSYKFLIPALGALFMCGLNVWSSIDRIDEAEVFTALEEDGVYVPLIPDSSDSTTNTTEDTVNGEA